MLVARYCGEKNYDGVQQTVQTSLLTGLVGGVILVVLGIVLARPMLTLMKTPDEVIEGAVLYMRVYFIGMPATMIYNFGAAVLRAVGDTRRPLYFLMAAGVMNVLGDLLFVSPPRNSAIAHRLPTSPRGSSRISSICMIMV